MASETVAREVPHHAPRVVTAAPRTLPLGALVRLSARPFLHSRFEDVQRKGPLAQQLIVKGADVEICALLTLGVAPHRADRQLPALVGERLRWRHDVAIHFS